ncbi:MAG: sugar phosphate isomerase/epimerase family protein [Candidatus Thorarchaeota archaeon]|jgi:sugar phosphate isomerase/epimerase
MSSPTRFAYHVIYDKSLDSALEYARDTGWSGIVPDIGVPRFSPDRYSATDRRQLREKASEFEIEWGFHAPGDDVGMFTTYPSIRKAIMEYFKGIVDFARDVSESTTNMVIHTGKPPSFRKAGDEEDAYLNENLDAYESVFFENILELIEYAQPDVHIVLENHGWTPLIRHGLPSLIARGLKLCLDIPKIYDSNLNLIKSDWRMFQQYPESIEVVHVHDFIPSLRSHQIVGHGSIDFELVLSLLTKLEQSVQYVVEVRPREAATESLHKFKELYSRAAHD